MGHEQTCVRRLRDSSLRFDPSLRELFDDSRDAPRDLRFRPEFDGANTRSGRFDKWGKRVSELQHDLLDRGFLGTRARFYDQLQATRQTLARRHSAMHA